MKLLLMNDPALRQVCEPVLLEELDFIKSLIPEMTKILNAENGVALAANQVGIIKRFFLMKDGRVIINPEILDIGSLTPFEEGCLSIPGTSASTQRAQRVKIKYKDLSFNDLEEDFVGINAVAIQHEIDHLNGKLYIDQFPPMRKTLILNKHREFMKARGRRK